MSKVTGPIQLKRGSGNILSETQKTTILAEGEPFYHKGAEFVTSGNGESMLSDLPRLGVGANISLIGAGNVSSIQVNNGAISVGEGGKVDVDGGGNIVLGRNAKTFSNDANKIAIGTDVRADGANVIAIGTCASADTNSSNSVAIGALAQTFGTSVIAIGQNVSAGHVNEVVSDIINIGTNNAIGLNGAIAIGANTAVGTYSVLSGKYSGGNNAVCIGRKSNIIGDNSIAIGSNTVVGSRSEDSSGTAVIKNADGAICIGTQSCAYMNSTIAIGNGAEAFYSKSISIGASAGKYIDSTGIKVSGNNSVSIGASSYGGDSCTSIGYKAGQYRTFNPPLGCVCVGSNSGFISSSESGLITHSIALGSAAIVSQSYTAQLLNNNIESPTLKVGNKTVVLTDSNGCDARIKQNVTDADTSICLADVNRLKVSRFEYKSFVEGIVDKHRTGWMADDVEKVFKNAVYRRDDTFPELDEKGEKVYEEIELEDGTKQKVEKRFVIKDVQHLDMTTIGLPTLWGAVQELSKLMTATQERITELENAVKALKKENTLLKKQVKALEDFQKSGPEIGA